MRRWNANALYPILAPVKDVLLTNNCSTSSHMLPNYRSLAIMAAKMCILRVYDGIGRSVQYPRIWNTKQAPSCADASLLGSSHPFQRVPSRPSFLEIGSFARSFWGGDVYQPLHTHTVH